jgi:cation diffusion facilitator CzcD-associated flavoprotein CzcO
VLARKVVIATGVDGAGGPALPDVTDSVPKTLYAHSSHDIDFSRLSGKRVAVLGAGASAFDNAATALEAGAREVVQFVRRPALSQVNALRFLETSGFFRNFGSLDDQRKVRFMRHYLSLPTPPPADTLQRCHAHANFVVRFGEGWTRMQAIGDKLRITTPARTLEADFAILGTGFRIDLSRVPFLAPVVAHLVLWKDRAKLGSDIVDERLGRYPYLGPAMQATGRTPEADGVLRNLHFFNISGVPSVGLISSGINGLPWGVDAIALAISRDLFRADADSFYEEFTGYNESDKNEAYNKVAAASERRPAASH